MFRDDDSTDYSIEKLELTREEAKRVRDEAARASLLMGLENIERVLLVCLLGHIISLQSIDLSQVLSGKGGVGKSSITTQLALSLSLAGNSVGILDIDLTGPSIPRLLGIEDAKIKQAPGGWLPVEVHPAQLLSPAVDFSQPDGDEPIFNGEGASHPPLTRNGSPTATLPPRPIGALYAISLGFLLPSRSSAVVWRGPKKTAMVRQFLTDVHWPKLDYLLIDTPPGTSDEHISLAETLLQQTSFQSQNASPQLAGAVIVTTPQAVAVSDVRKELSFCRKVGIRVLGVVENMSGYVCECCGKESNLFGKGGGEVMAKEFDVRFLGGVPVDGQWGSLVEEGKRPRYDGEVVKDYTDDDEFDDHGDGKEIKKQEIEVNRSDVNARNGVSPRPDDGLLVDKYRSCSLCAIFEGITRQLTSIVESSQTNGT
ncbi:MAG: hypothetical protein Q9209_005714 [Squamulea sp. 1 TL-2023]